MVAVRRGDVQSDYVDASGQCREGAACLTWAPTQPAHTTSLIAADASTSNAQAGQADSQVPGPKALTGPGSSRRATPNQSGSPGCVGMGKPVRQWGGGHSMPIAVSAT